MKLQPDMWNKLYTYMVYEKNHDDESDELDDIQEAPPKVTGIV